MIDNKEVLTRLKLNGKLDAVKYVKLNSSMLLKQAKEYVENLESQNPHFQLPKTGTIEWFKCEDQLPPIEEDSITNKSALLLIWKEGCDPTCATYFHDIELWRHTNGNWKPTHWAFINHPND